MLFWLTKNSFLLQIIIIAQFVGKNFFYFYLFIYYFWRNLIWEGFKIILNTWPYVEDDIDW